MLLGHEAYLKMKISLDFGIFRLWETKIIGALREMGAKEPGVKEPLHPLLLSLLFVSPHNLNNAIIIQLVLRKF